MILVLFASSASAAYAGPTPAAADFRNDPVKAVSGCLEGALTIPPGSARTAFLIPTFTLTPYTNFDDSFYAFYAKYKQARGSVVTDLNWLKTKVTNEWSHPNHNDEKPLYDFLTSQTAARCGIVEGLNLKMIDDVAVDGGALFAGKERQYDVLILGHEEYVTRAEYNQLKQFVATGGRLVEMSGNSFWAQVNYSRNSGMETFVVGHGFKFDGTKAWKTTYAPFDAESAGWFGSTFGLGVYTIRGAVLEKTGAFAGAMARASHSGTAFTTYSYPHDEVNYLRNFTGTQIVAKFYASVHTLDGKLSFLMPHLPVDAYVHRYGKGEVVCLCVFGEELISHDRSAQFFLVYSATAGPALLSEVGVRLL
jgi:hypothetical protein